MKLLRYLLLPISLLYGLVVFIRNKFYDFGILKSHSFSIPIISIGNLEVGGSGKTPMVEYLIKLLKSYSVSTLSRGYGRKTKGFRWVVENDNPILSGDEPLQIKNKFPEISVAVCENRVFAINKIKGNHELVIMDDAYQHRAVKPGLSLLLFDYNTFDSFRLMLPAGNYRELFAGRKRADFMVVTKTPENLSLSKQQNIERQLSPLANQKVFFSYIKYSENWVNIFNGEILALKKIRSDTTVLLITGIAKSKPLVEKTNEYFSDIIHHSYEDHHQFSEKNMRKLVSDFNQLKGKEKIIITTQKDAVRLRTDEYKKLIGYLPIYEWPIETAFHNNGASNFDNDILEYVKKHKSIS